jgi:2-amino-4-hydroxy-6-hydroxymethyldihydropteridine diphosphokinase
VDRVAIALGSNLGDRVSHLDHAVARLQTVIRHLRVSRYYETAPVGVSGPQPVYLNAAAVGTTTLSPRALLETLLAIERERGRERPRPAAPRTLDLDLVLFGDIVIDEQGLTVPHPRFRDRRFVLEPLAEIAPDFPDPVTGRRVADLLTDLAAVDAAARDSRTPS